MIAASSNPVGHHLAHIVLFAVWFGVIALVLLIDHIRERRRGNTTIDNDAATEGASLESDGPAQISMATWPPQRPRTNT